MSTCLPSGDSLPRNYSAKVRGDVWELRPEYGNVEYRLLFAWIEGQFFLIAHALVKKGRKLSSRDIAIAEDRIQEVQAYYARPDRPEPPPIRR
jgi:phage-related protein